MLYFFIINGRADRRETICAEVKRQLAECPVEHQTYITIGPGDAVRHVRLYCDLHPREEVCFIACGGSGTLNEVASGIVGFNNKKLACLAYGSTNDLCKSFPDRDFKSLKKILGGEEKKFDILQAGDNYSLNVINVGFDAMAANEMNLLMEQGVDPAIAVRRGSFNCLLENRFNKIEVFADGIRLSGKKILLATFANASWYGGGILCAPDAKVDDGLMDVNVIKTVSLLGFFRMFKKYFTGKHFDDRFCQKKMVSCKASHVELVSEDLMYLCLDGDIIASSSLSIDVLPGAIGFIMPAD